MAIHVFILAFILILFFSCVKVHSYKPNVTIAIDGSGNFITINEAISKIPIGRHNPFVILIKQGIYIEVVYIGKNKSNLVLIGESMEKTIVQFNKSAKQCYEISRSATVGKVLFSYKSSTFFFFLIFNFIQLSLHATL